MIPEHLGLINIFGPQRTMASLSHVPKSHNFFPWLPPMLVLFSPDPLTSPPPPPPLGRRRPPTPIGGLQRLQRLHPVLCSDQLQAALVLHELRDGRAETGRRFCSEPSTDFIEQEQIE